MSDGGLSLSPRGVADDRSRRRGLGAEEVLGPRRTVGVGEDPGGLEDVEAVAVRVLLHQTTSFGLVPDRRDSRHPVEGLGEVLVAAVNVHHLVAAGDNVQLPGQCAANQM